MLEQVGIDFLEPFGLKMIYKLYGIRVEAGLIVYNDYRKGIKPILCYINLPCDKYGEIISPLRYLGITLLTQNVTKNWGRLLDSKDARTIWYFVRGRKDQFKLFKKAETILNKEMAKFKKALEQQKKEA
jgi:hypothetical protein